MTEDNKDIVAASLKLDASKILPAFKEIDASAKMLKSTFETLKQEIDATEVSVGKMAKSMDKVALSADERKAKIMAESQSLIALRMAQKEYVEAKTQQLDAVNQIVDAKLMTQQAIQKKREDAIEQQEREHQQRMLTLEQRTAEASARENLIQTKIDREFLAMKNGDVKLEQEAERHLARMQSLSQQPASSSSNNVLATSLQYLASGTLYNNTIQGAKEAIKVISQFEDSLVNLKRVMNAGADLSIVKESMIQDAKEYGYALKDVGGVYVQIAQQGFNEKDTAMLAKTALMAANVESSFRDASQAQELLTGAILNYNMAATDSERLLDRLNQVSNDYATDSNKLLQGINRVGAAAKNSGVDINELIGYLTVLNEAGFSGSVAGNAVKSFISFSSRDIAIDKLEKYVGTIKQATGEMMPFSEILQKISKIWNQVSDAERHEITQAVARGDQASRFIALMDNYGKVVKVAETAENSLGSAHRENELAMTTLSKQTAQLKAAWDSLMISIGDSGLLSILKSIVHNTSLLVDGFNSLPSPLRNTLTAVLTLGIGITALNAGMNIMTGQSLVALATGLATGARSMLGLTTATNAANVAQKAFIATPLGAALTALAGLIGVATVAWSYYSGKTNDASTAMNTNSRETMELTKRYETLKATVDSNTKSDTEIKQAKAELATVVEKLSGLMPDLISQWDAHGKAVDINIDKLREWKDKYKETIRLVETDNVTKYQDQLKQLQSRDKELESQMANISQSDLSLWDKVTGQSVSSYRIDFAKERLANSEEIEKVKQQLANSQKTLSSLDPMIGPTVPSGYKNHGGKAPDPEDRKKQFDDEMSEFRHLVNVEAEGYQDASEQLAKLQAIRSSFSDLSTEALYGIDEEIYRAQKGIRVKPKGINDGKTNSFKFPLDDIDNEVKQAKSLVESATGLIDFFEARRSALGESVDDSAEKIELYTSKQSKLEQANITLRGSLTTLNQRQEQLNALYSNGAISQEDYNKATEDVTSRIASITKEVDQNSIAWWNQAKSIKDARDQYAQEQFNFSEKWIAHEKATREMTAQEEYDAWVRVQQRQVEGSELAKKADEEVYRAKKALDREQYELSDRWIAHQKATREMTAQEEYDAWVRVQRRQVEGSDLAKKADEEVYRAKKALLKEHETDLTDFVQKEKKWINESKQAELQKIADEKDAFVKAQDEKIKAIEDAKEAYDRDTDDRIRSIQNEKDAFVRAQDIKIKAIDDLLKAEQQSNEDKDYEKQLKAKKDRLNVLEAGVGPDAIKERKQLLQEIEKMQEDHNRDLRKRDLENQKSQLQDEKQATQDRLDDTRKQLEEEKRLKDQAWQDDKKRLEEEKKTKQAAFDQQKKDAETYYSNLLTAFDNFKNDAEGRAELLKSMQITKESEKNQTILSNLDKFISEYQTKMSRLGNLRSQYDLDLEEYNSNKDRWEEAAARGDTASMDRYNQRNDQLRNQYGVGEDTGKLQHFSEGGYVKGQLGQPVGVIAHAGELVLNPNQQSNLFKLLNMAAPQVMMPTFDYSGPKQVNNYYYSFDNSIGSVAVNDGNGAAGLYDQREGLIGRQRTLGMKVR